MTKNNTSTLTLSGTNTYTGTTTVNDGTLVLSGGSAIADAGAVVTANVATAGLKLNSSETIGNLAGGGTTGGNVNLQDNTLTTGDATNTVFDGVISGTNGALVKQGTGAFTLTGANTYTGTTAVNDGQLHVSGSLSTGAVSVGDSVTPTLASAAVLSGNGTIGGVVTVGSGTNPTPTSVGILAPGGSLGAGNGTLTLTAANTALTVADGSQIQLGITNPTTGTLITFLHGVYTYNGNNYNTAKDLFDNEAGAVAAWNVAPTTTTDHDFLNLTGSNSTLSVGDRASAAYGDGSIKVTGVGLTTVDYGMVFNVIDWKQVGAIQGTFNVGSGFVGGVNAISGDLDLPDLTAITGSWAWDTSAFANYGILVVVPEPSRALFLMLGLLGLMLRRRRRSGI